jgi:hypothetical protein
METHYRGAIWTHHAMQRITERGFDQDAAGWTFTNPDSIQPGKQPGTQEYKKRFNDKTITLIGKKNDQGEWIIISAWIDPPIAGTADHKKREEWKKYKKANFWGKLWYIFKKQLGG